MIHKITMLRVV